MIMPEVVLPDDMTSRLKKYLRDWIIIGVFSFFILIITLIMIYYKIGNVTLLKILAVVQFGLIFVAIGYYLEFRKTLLKIRCDNARSP